MFSSPLDAKKMNGVHHSSFFERLKDRCNNAIQNNCRK